jgi:hypothetical protein
MRWPRGSGRFTDDQSGAASREDDDDLQRSDYGAVGTEHRLR